MTFIEIIDTFAFYGADVMLLGALTAVLIQVFKLTFLKRVKKKLLTFLPFVLGTLFYGIYAAIRNLSFMYVLENYTQILEHGISVGSVATLLYVLYEQFVREKDKLSATQGIIATLIEGYVPTEKAESIARLIAEAVEKDVTGNGAARAAEILTENAGEEISDLNVELLARLIIETLAHLNTK